jgi:hypothetical protein
LDYYPILKMVKLSSSRILINFYHICYTAYIDHKYEYSEIIILRWACSRYHWIHLNILLLFHFQSQLISSLLQNISDPIKLLDSEDVFGCMCICCWVECPAVLRRRVANQLELSMHEKELEQTNDVRPYRSSRG